jgi:hypothetical protein
MKLCNDQRNAQVFNLFIYLLLPYMFTQFHSKHNETFYIRQLTAGFSFQRTGFDPRAIHARSVGDKVAMGHVPELLLRFLPVSVPFQQRSIIIHLPSTLHNLNTAQGISVRHAPKNVLKKVSNLVSELRASYMLRVGVKVI